METVHHRALKHLALRFLRAAGCCAFATEVRCPIARFRVDAAGYLDPLPKRAATDTPPITATALPRGRSAKTVIIECKQSRADFLADAKDADLLLAERDRLQRVRSVLEENILKACEPHLRQSGTKLFAELEDWDFSKSSVSSYRAVLTDLRRIDEKLYGESKFWRLAHYRLADWLFLAAPRGCIAPREVPAGWGLLNIDPADLQANNPCSTALAVRVHAPELTGKPEHRARLLRNIAVAHSMRSHSSRDHIDSTADDEPSLPEPFHQPAAASSAHAQHPHPR